MSDLLTGDEFRAIELTGELMGLLSRIIDYGRTREADLAEMAVFVHGIQTAVMSQAAARAYPTKFRRLGNTLRPSS